MVDIGADKDTQKERVINSGRRIEADKQLSGETIMSMVKMPFFDSEGRRVYLYCLSNYSCGIFYGCYEKITAEQIEAHVEDANRIWEEYLRELDSTPPISKEDTEISKEDTERLDKKYPMEEWDIGMRICKYLKMWQIEADLDVLAVSKNMQPGCMGD